MKKSNIKIYQPVLFKLNGRTTPTLIFHLFPRPIKNIDKDYALKMKKWLYQSEVKVPFVIDDNQKRKIIDLMYKRYINPNKVSAYMIDCQLQSKGIDIDFMMDKIEVINKEDENGIVEVYAKLKNGH